MTKKDEALQNTMPSLELATMHWWNSMSALDRLEVARILSGINLPNTDCLSEDAIQRLYLRHAYGLNYQESLEVWQEVKTCTQQKIFKCDWKRVCREAFGLDPEEWANDSYPLDVYYTTEQLNKLRAAITVQAQEQGIKIVES